MASPMKKRQHRPKLGQGAYHALPLFRSDAAPPRQILPPDSIISHLRNLVSFLLPSSRYARGMLYAGTAFSVAGNQSFDSSRRMQCAIEADSKLCMVRPCHATSNFLSEIVAAQLAKGQGFAPPRLIPSLALRGPAETVPVSAPFGFHAGAPDSWAVRP
jgi:hypothetical protein